MLDPPSGGARRAAKRLRLRVLRWVVVLVAPRSGGRRRVLHRLPLPSLPVAWRASPLGFRVCLSLAGCGGWGSRSVRVGRSVGAQLCWRRGFNGGRRMPLLCFSSLCHHPASDVVRISKQFNGRSSVSELYSLLTLTGQMLVTPYIILPDH